MKNQPKKDTDRVIIIPYHYHGCITVINPTDTIYAAKSINNKRIADTIFIDTNGLALTPITYFDGGNSSEFYLSDTNNKLTKVNLIKDPIERVDHLPAIMVTNGETIPKLFDYKTKKYSKEKEIFIFEYFIFNKDTCYCNEHRRSKNIDSIITASVQQYRRKKPATHSR